MGLYNLSCRNVRNSKLSHYCGMHRGLRRGGGCGGRSVVSTENQL